MIYSEPGVVLECLREHYTFTLAGGLVVLEKGELLIVVEVENFQGKAIRVETSELVYLNLLELPTFENDPVNKRTYSKVWP